MPFIAIYITHPDESTAQQISDALINQKLVACTNIFPIQSIYPWDGAIQRDAEWVSIVKTQMNNWEQVQEAVEKLHPYEVPCIIKYEVTANKAYEDWIIKESTPLRS